MEETKSNKLHFQNPENIFVSHHLQGRGHIVSAAVQAAGLLACLLFASVSRRNWKQFYSSLMHSAVNRPL